MSAVLARLGARVPAGLALLDERTSDRTASLFPAELEHVQHAVSSRRNEFSTGRWLARRGLAALGVAPAPLLPGQAREPMWPSGIVGSLSHSASVCAVALAPADRFAGVGLDLELSEAPKPDLAPLILSSDEPEHYASSETLRLVFSAKESVYKCLYPLCRRFIDFAEVTIRIDDATGEFSARIDDPALQRLLDRGAGIFERDATGAVTLFTLPHGA